MASLNTVVELNMDSKCSKRKVLIVGDLCLSRYSLLPALLSQNMSDNIEFYLTDLSDGGIKGIIDGLLYDFVIYFVDMKSLRSWRIVDQAITAFSSYFSASNEYMVVNNMKQTGVHTFTLSRITEVTKPHGIPLLAFSEKDERLQAEVCFSLIHQILGQHPSSLVSVLHDKSWASVAAYVL